MKTRLIALLLLAAGATFSGDFISGGTDCPTSGTKQVSAVSYSGFQLTVQAKFDNAGTITVGSKSVTASTGTVLVPGGSLTESKPNPGVNPNTLYFVCTTNTDGLTWLASR